MSLSNNSASTNSLPISSDQTLRDLYLNTRSSMSSPRKIFFRRVRFSKLKSMKIKRNSSFSYHSTTLNWNNVEQCEFFSQIHKKKMNNVKFNCTFESLQLLANFSTKSNSGFQLSAPELAVSS